jgi:hypothetical protein
VNGDINGDGLSNDRAFVYDPAAAADPALASGMRALLASGSTSARDCLTAQLSHVATRNSCSAPWTQSLNMAISPDLTRYGLADRASVSLVVTNVFAFADQVLHGSDHLRNWGANAAPDPVRLNVRRFDPVTNRFGYDVNPSFGSTSASANTLCPPQPAAEARSAANINAPSSSGPVTARSTTSSTPMLISDEQLSPTAACAYSARGRTRFNVDVARASTRYRVRVVREAPTIPPLSVNVVERLTAP